MTTIKCTSRMSKGMELNGNVLSGDTFGAREYIKTYWDGRWIANNKVWIVDPEKVTRTIQEQKFGFAKVLSISESQPAKIALILTNKHNIDGWCARCQDWTYGDCGHS